MAAASQPLDKGIRAGMQNSYEQCWSFFSNQMLCGASNADSDCTRSPRKAEEGETSLFYTRYYDLKVAENDYVAET